MAEKEDQEDRVIRDNRACHAMACMGDWGIVPRDYLPGHSPIAIGPEAWEPSIGRCSFVPPNGSSETGGDSGSGSD